MAKKDKNKPGNKLMDQKFINSHWRRRVRERIESGEMPPEDDPPEADVFRDIEIALSRAPGTVRLDAHLVGRFSNISRAYFQRMIREGEVLVNDRPRKPGYSLKLGDVIRLSLPEMPDRVIVPEDIPLDIIHEDDDLLVLNKPPGIIIHPGRGNQSGTLANGIIHHILRGAPNDDNVNPGIVHRLDKNTTGVIATARNPFAHTHLSRQFMQRRVGKTYLAVVSPAPAARTGEIRADIGYDPRDRQLMTCAADAVAHKHAHTEYEVLERFGDAALLAVSLHTGRTHQIRAHLEHIGCPVIGDPAYNRIDPPEADACAGPRHATMGRQALHAWKLTVTHPATKQKITFTAPLPADFEALLAALRAG